MEAGEREAKQRRQKAVEGERGEGRREKKRGGGGRVKEDGKGGKLGKTLKKLASTSPRI